MKTTFEVDLKSTALDRARAFARMNNSDLASLVSQYIEELAEQQDKRESHAMRPTPHQRVEGLSHTGHFLG
jgi:hypothetical protein